MDGILAGKADNAAIAGISDGSKSGGNKLTLGPGVWLTGAAFVAVEMAVSARYGFYSDELYFLAAGRHLAFGYVDQPPLVPLLTRVSTIVFGDSLSALRVLPAIAGGALVVIAGLIARLLGGGRAASLLTALAVGCAPVTLMAAHFATTTIYDLLSWSALLALTLAAVLRHRPKLWLAAGAVTGVALENNNLILLLVAALLCGLVMTRRWEVLRTPWLLAGAALALALWAPYLAWQATHGWPELTVARALQILHSSAQDHITVVPAELAYLGLVALPLAVVGATRLCARPVAAVPRHRGRSGVRVRDSRGSRPTLLPGRPATADFRRRRGHDRIARFQAADAAGLDARTPDRCRPERRAVSADPANLCSPRAAVPAQAQLRYRRDHRLAAADGGGGPRVQRAASRPARPGEHLHKWLRRGSGHLLVWTCAAAADAAVWQQ